MCPSRYGVHPARAHFPVISACAHLYKVVRLTGGLAVSGEQERDERNHLPTLAQQRKPPFPVKPYVARKHERKKKTGLQVQG